MLYRSIVFQGTAMIRPLPLPQSRGNIPSSGSLVGNNRFRMRWSVADWMSEPVTSSSEISVVLVADPADMYPVLEALENESKCIGIDIVTGPNGNKPVVSLSCDNVIFSVESSLLRPIDIRILFSFLSGLRTPLVSLRDLPFTEFFDSSSNFPNVKKVITTSSVRSPPPSGPTRDPDILAITFGQSCFQARQSHLSPRNLGVYSEMMTSKPSPRPGTFEEFGRMVTQKRQRTIPTSTDEPVEPVLFTEDPPPLADEPPLDNNAKRFLEWFQ